MNTHGNHLLVEYWGCCPETLDDRTRLEQLLTEAALAADTTIVQSVFHGFAPQGVSGVVVIEESHLSIHTWPEAGYAAVDFYTCGDADPSLAHDVLMIGLGCARAEIVRVERGRADGDVVHTRIVSKDTPTADPSQQEVAS